MGLLPSTGEPLSRISCRKHKRLSLRHTIKGDALHIERHADSGQEKENKRTLGSRYEQMAADFLREQGAVIVEKNYRCRHGEIDLIVRDGRYLVFVEVKYRSSGRMGDPAEAVHYYKQQRIRQTARYYLYSRRYGENTPCRFDVISILGDRIHWIRNAF